MFVFSRVGFFCRIVGGRGYRHTPATHIGTHIHTHAPLALLSSLFIASQLTAHGPGMYLSKHLPDQLGHQANSPRRRNNHHRRRGGGGARQEEDAGATSTATTVPTLGDLDWDQPEGPLVLLWDGRGIDGVEVPDPSPENRPIRLVVSKV